MSTADKCQAILSKMLELATERRAFTLAGDFGGNTATVIVGDAHTHVGNDGATWEQFVDELHATLYGGPGLSWSKSPPPEPPAEADIAPQLSPSDAELRDKFAVAAFQALITVDPKRDDAETARDAWERADAAMDARPTPPKRPPPPPAPPAVPTT